jgi:hypothetical protein
MSNQEHAEDWTADSTLKECLVENGAPATIEVLANEIVFDQ